MAQTDSNPFRRAADGERGSPADPTARPVPAIGFNELRQACEISALREDAARLAGEVEALRAHVEDGVGAVRGRVAALRAEELADPDVMAALLQFAVGTLIGIRDRTRALDMSRSALDDATRPGWDVTRAISERDDPRRLGEETTTSAQHPPSTPTPQPTVPVRGAHATADALVRSGGGRSPPSPMDAPPAPLAAPETPRPGATTARRDASHAVDHHAVDWLGPARR